ncbi:MAG: adenosylcobinamide-GDP ribazoletransferase, partial [Xanthobacteraceae bacterium]
AGGISATFNAPITGVFFGVEIILREFAVDALFTVMLSAMIADAVAIPFLGDKPFLSGFPAGITLGSPRNYLLVALLAVIAALMAWLATRQIGGQTGDVLGALEQLSEIAVLLAALA